jgi:hypothetical protein
MVVIIYGSWIYNYLCNQCLLPVTLWVQILLGQGVLDTTICNKFVGDLRQVDGFLRILRFPLLIKLSATIYLKFSWKWWNQLLKTVWTTVSQFKFQKLWNLKKALFFSQLKLWKKLIYATEGLGLWCLMPFSTKFQIDSGTQFY